MLLKCNPNKIPASMNYISIVFSCNYIYIVDCVQMNPSNLDEKFSEKKQTKKSLFFVVVLCEYLLFLLWIYICMYLNCDENVMLV